MILQFLFFPLLFKWFNTDSYSYTSSIYSAYFPEYFILEQLRKDTLVTRHITLQLGRKNPSGIQLLKLCVEYCPVYKKPISTPSNKATNFIIFTVSGYSQFICSKKTASRFSARIARFAYQRDPCTFLLRNKYWTEYWHLKTRLESEKVRNPYFFLLYSV